MRERKYYYLEIDREHCELPVRVADTIVELAEMAGVSASAVTHSVQLHPDTGRFVRVLRDEKDIPNRGPGRSTGSNAKSKHKGKGNR